MKQDAESRPRPKLTAEQLEHQQDARDGLAVAENEMREHVEALHQAVAGVVSRSTAATRAALELEVAKGACCSEGLHRTRAALTSFASTTGDEPPVFAPAPRLPTPTAQQRRLVRAFEADHHRPVPSATPTHWSQPDRTPN